MLFTEPRFLYLFLPLVLLCYYVFPRPAKNALLLAASILFYGVGEGYYTTVVIVSIVFNYFQGHFIDMKEDARWRAQTLAFGVGCNLLVLIVFKYAAFVVENLNGVLALLQAPTIRQPKMHLPVGISFFTFHAISYLTDIYRREVKPMRRFDSFALYITLFPQLVAGPIIRYKTICDQFDLSQHTADGISSGRRHSFDDFAEGIRRFILGLGKKMLIANTAAEAADAIFNVPGAQVTPAAAWLGVACYTLQIYFDFSGYSDMAIGLARMVGFRFPENFNYPYIARNITDFWRRWHISLSSWFRDYLYIPLGGNRISPRRTYFNLMVVFFLCGLWHGATWNFVIWGLFHGTFLILERAGLSSRMEKSPRPLQHLYLLVIVMVGWVFFRAETLPHALQYLGRMAFLQRTGPDDAPLIVFLNPQLLIVLAAGVLGSMPWMPRLVQAWSRAVQPSPAETMRGVGVGGPRATAVVVAGRCIELAGLGSILVLSCAFSAAGTYNPFIYFRF